MKAPIRNVMIITAHQGNFAFVPPNDRRAFDGRSGPSFCFSHDGSFRGIGRVPRRTMILVSRYLFFMQGPGRRAARHPAD